MNQTPANRNSKSVFNHRNQWALIFVLGINLFLGIILWFDFLTDYSFTNKTIRIVYPLIVYLISIFSLISLARSTRRKGCIWKKTKVLACCYPSLVGGSFYVLMMPVVLLITILVHYNLRQEVVSPDGRRIAELHRCPWVVDDSVQVRVYHSSFPFVERIVDNDPYTYAIEWKDNYTLQLQHSSHQKEIDMRTIGPAQEVAGAYVFKYAIYGTLLAALIILVIWYTPGIGRLFKRLLDSIG